MRAVQAELARLFAAHGLVPRQVQTDRGSCFIGAEGDAVAAVPSRLTLWLAGLGVGHRPIPVRRPQHNGAVERFHGGVERSWQGEPDGLAALAAVWNATRPPLSEGHRAYPGRAGFDLGRVWALLSQTRVRRRVDRQGKLSLWDHPIRAGARLAGQEVTVTFDPDARRVVVRDAHERVARQAPLGWLTEEWLWQPVPPPDQRAHPPDPPTFP
jgi:transposase InsO family protein